MTSDTMATTRNTKNSTCAIEEAPAAMPPKPKIAATIATTKKTRAQYNIVTSHVASPTGQRPFGRRLDRIRDRNRRLILRKLLRWRRERPGITVRYLGRHRGSRRRRRWRGRWQVDVHTDGFSFAVPSHC